MDDTSGSSKTVERRSEKKVVFDKEEKVPRLPGRQLMHWRQAHTREHALMMRWLNREPFKVGLLNQSGVSSYPLILLTQRIPWLLVAT
jgi:hypothetical protein